MGDTTQGEILLFKMRADPRIKLDAEDLVKYRFKVVSYTSGGRYLTFSGDRGERVYLHKAVLGITEGEVDHINGKTLDCRRSNLRKANRSQNNSNQNLRSDNTSGFKGVYYSKRGNRWVATVNGRYLGRYKDKYRAAVAYNKEAEKVQGQFAKLNYFPLVAVGGESE